jgi:hypothetical protein
MTTATQLPLTQYHYNRQLFADYYLNTVLPQRPDWKLLATESSVQSVLATITNLWQQYEPTTSEAQLEHDFVRPVLEALGHTFEVQPSLKTPDGTKRPDYVLYRDEAGRSANKGTTLTEELLHQTAFAVMDAKYWERPLDTALHGKGGDPFSNKNPAYQIDFYMRHSGTEWGILTNGRLWRLYHQASSKKLDRFYEIDLPGLLQTGNPEAFLYFYAFFHRSAFDDHPLGVAALRRESINAAQGISDNIKQQVYTALRHLAQGMLDYSPNQLQPDSATLKTIYDHCLIVLYRLLFILYAEARDLLPVRGSDMYQESYSLYAIAREVARNIDQGKQLLPNSGMFWSQLRELFHFIDQGSPPLHVATFNGGLFDPYRYSFLEDQSIGDARLQQAIDLLTRVEGQFVDYRDLAERHLGTIYEGLLEYHLRPIDPEGYWTIDLFNDKGERKVSGSYYTPDFVVEYMVEQTVGPVLEAAVADAPDDHAKRDAVLHTNVADPAMGSGHFLVTATEYIARFLVDLDVPIEDGNGETDLAYWKRRVAQTCIYGVDLNPLAVDLAKLSLWLATVAQDKPLSFLDHHLRCGNALVGAPLDNLRPAETANQKKAKRKAQQSVAAGQRSMLEDESFRQSMSTAVDAMWLIERTAGDTIDQVREQERLYDGLREQLTRKFGTMADLSTATHFGVEIDPSFWRPLYDYTTGRSITLPAKLEQLIIAAAEQAERLRFFHWELEFPEIFFDKHGQPLGEQAGFDAVIGNPPYVRQEALAPFKPYFAQKYADVYHGAADLYVYFSQQGLRLLRQGGRMAYIVTNKWLRSGYGEALRGYFAAHAALEQIVDFGHAPLFPEADVFPCIVVLSRPDSAKPPDDQQVQITEFPREELGKTTLPRYVAEHSHSVPQQRFSSAAWSLETAEGDDLLAKIRAKGVPLSDFMKATSYRGIITGLNDAFLIDNATRDQLVQVAPACAEIIKPYLRGQDIKRWSPEWDELWMIVLKSSSNHSWPWSAKSKSEAETLFQQTYPSLYAHMKPLEQQLRQRKNQGHYWWELQSCSFYHLFAQPKLLYQEIQFHSWFAFDDAANFTNNKVFLLPSADLYLLAVLNSPLMWWHNWRYLPHMKDEALNPAGFLMETLPIAPPTDDIRAEVESVVERLIAITKTTQQANRTMLDWLYVEFAIEKSGQKLEDFARLNEHDFIAEVRKRRPKQAGTLKSAALKTLREEYQEQAIPVQHLRTEAQQLERRLSSLVNAAYGLTPAEVDLLWRTAPPRMPGL